MPDSPPFTDADARAFARLLATDLPTAPDVDPAAPLQVVDVDVEPAPDPGEPGPPEDAGDDDGDDPSTHVSLWISRSDGSHVSASAVLQDPVTTAELARAARACTAGALAQLAALDGPELG